MGVEQVIGRRMEDEAGDVAAAAELHVLPGGGGRRWGWWRVASGGRRRAAAVTPATAASRQHARGEHRNNKESSIAAGHGRAWLEGGGHVASAPIRGRTWTTVRAPRQHRRLRPG